MRCDKCKNEAVFIQSSSGRYLCSRHLALDVEARAKRTIRSHRWMKSGDHIAIVLSGEKKSSALLCFLKNLISGRRDIRLSVIIADEGAAGRALPEAADLARLLQIPVTEILLHAGPGGVVPEQPTKIALASTLDDIAREVLEQFLSGSAEILIRPPAAGTGGIPVICPFIGIPSEEVDYYGDYAGIRTAILPGATRDCIPFPEEETGFLEYYRRHPATRFALVNLAESLSGSNGAGIAAGIAVRDLNGLAGILRGGAGDDT
jgi:tRNA(Ile)-lysidine synthase TilS/MesJ